MDREKVPGTKLPRTETTWGGNDLVQKIPSIGTRKATPEGFREIE